VIKLPKVSNNVFQGASYYKDATVKSFKNLFKALQNGFYAFVVYDTHLLVHTLLEHKEKGGLRLTEKCIPQTTQP
jgi:hypothetical protein